VRPVDVLAAGLCVLAARKRLADGENTSAEPVARLEHDDVESRAAQLVGRRQAREARAHDDHPRARVGPAPASERDRPTGRGSRGDPCRTGDEPPPGQASLHDLTKGRPSAKERRIEDRQPGGGRGTMTEPDETLTDEEIDTRDLHAVAPSASDDGDDAGDTGDDSGDTGDDSGDTGDDSGDTADVSDTGDDSGDTGDDSAA
jgi:hypothetical protein